MIPAVVGAGAINERLRRAQQEAMDADMRRQGIFIIRNRQDLAPMRHRLMPDPLLELAARQEQEQIRRAKAATEAAKIRSDRLARKQANFEKRKPKS